MGPPERARVVEDLENYIMRSEILREEIERFRRSGIYNFKAEENENQSGAKRAELKAK